MQVHATTLANGPAHDDHTRRVTLVEHETTGLVFDTPDDSRRQARRLVDDERFADRIGLAGREFVRQAHGLRPERAAYAAVLQRMTENLLPGTGAPPRKRIVRINSAGRRAVAFGAAEDPAIAHITKASAPMPAEATRLRPQVAASS